MYSRPVFIIGGGVKFRKDRKQFLKNIKQGDIPIVTTWSGYDLIDRNHPNYLGNYGVYGERAANLAIQNADLILAYGSRMDTRQISTKPKGMFAREALVIVDNIDKAENERLKKLGFEINTNQEVLMADRTKWLTKCREWKAMYPTVLPKYYKQKKYVNPYVLIKEMSNLATKDYIIIPDDGGHLTWTMQAWEIKEGQSLYSAFGNSPMGYAFPAAIGASFATKRPIVVIEGDGSFQINIQELVTLAKYRPNIKIFIMNNNGYGIIKQFQSLYLGGRYIGSNVPIPDFVKVSRAYGIPTETIKSHKELYKLKKILKHKGPMVIDVEIKPNQKLEPKLGYLKPLEDLDPPLPRKEFYKQMIVKPI